MERDLSQTKLAIGDKAPYFSLPATDGRIYSLADFSNAPAFVVIFTANHCPYAQAYEPRICSLADHFKKKGVHLIAICANDGDAYPEDNFENMVARSQSSGFCFPYLHDESQTVARAYDAACTPEAYLFDQDQILRYHGLIDDNYRDPSAVKHQYLADAISSVLEHQPIVSPKTAAIGCSIKWHR